jgi:hypothetical protein
VEFVELEVDLLQCIKQSQALFQRGAPL